MRFALEYLRRARPNRGGAIGLALLMAAAAPLLGNALFSAGSSTLRLSSSAAPPLPATVAQSPAPAPGAWREARYITTQDEWVAKLQSRDYWEGRRQPSSRAQSQSAPPSRDWSASRSSLGRAPGAGDNLFNRYFGSSRAARDSDDEAGGEGFRTVCVRTCDGFFWPISFSTTPDNFARDARKCESSCTGNARLYTYPNPGGQLEDMKDLKGQPYVKTATAFQYREKYNAACKCQAHPWEAEAQDRHQLYALEAVRGKARRGDKNIAVTAAEIKALKDKIARDTAAARATSASAAQRPGKAASAAGPAPRRSALERGPARPATATAAPPVVAPAPTQAANASSRPARNSPASERSAGVNIVRPPASAPPQSVRILRYGVYSRVDPAPATSRVR